VGGLSNTGSRLTIAAAEGLALVIGRRAAATVSVIIAGVAAGCTGALLGGVQRALGGYALFGGELWDWTIVVALLQSVPVGLAGGLIMGAQYAVSDTATPRLVYRWLARSGNLPPDLGHFLAWADDRLLRKTGDGYTFLHLLYRDWWAKQPVAPR
jgi:hypothetical protein